MQIKKIFVAGNTIVDSVKVNIKKSHNDLLKKYNIKSKKFFLSIHESNEDSADGV